MRISNINTFLGGARDIVASQLVQGSARNIAITIRDEDGNPIDITGNTFEFDTIDATATVTPNGSNFTLADLALVDGAAAASRDALVTTTNATAGEVTLYLPTDLFTGTVPFDAVSNVPIVVGTIRWSTGGSTPTIQSIRVLVVIRYGVVATV